MVIPNVVHGMYDIKTYLTFRGLCIVIYSYNKSKLDALFLKFVLKKNLPDDEM